MHVDVSALALLVVFQRLRTCSEVGPFHMHWILYGKRTSSAWLITHVSCN